MSYHLLSITEVQDQMAHTSYTLNSTQSPGDNGLDTLSHTSRGVVESWWIKKGSSELARAACSAPALSSALSLPRTHCYACFLPLCSFKPSTARCRGLYSHSEGPSCNSSSGGPMLPSDLHQPCTCIHIPTHRHIILK